MNHRIDSARVVYTKAAAGEDSCFVAVGSGGETGWYGPVSTDLEPLLQPTLTRAVLGMPVMDHCRIHSELCRLVRDFMSPGVSWAVGALDCATWDLHGRLVGEPVAALLSNNIVWQVRLYASWLNLDLSNLIDQAQIHRMGQGDWLFSKWSVRRGMSDDTAAEATRLASLIDLVAFSLNAPCAFDAVFTWDRALTEQLSLQLDRQSVLWIEDPLPDYKVDDYHALAGCIPLAIGERLSLDSNANALLDLRPTAFIIDVVACGGLTRCLDLVGSAAARGLPVYPHGRSFVPGLHLAAAFPGIIPAVEYRLHWEPLRQRQYRHNWQPIRGLIELPASPGLMATPRNH